MNDQMELVVGIVALNGGKLVGKTRLQKTIFILNACGLSADFEFEYGNFGPFSRGLAAAVEEAEVQGRIETEEKNGFHQVPYVVFKTSGDIPEKLGNLPVEATEKILGILAGFSAIILELAATIRYFIPDYKTRDQINEEVRMRKPLKATDAALKEAWQLLEKLDLAPL